MRLLCRLICLILGISLLAPAFAQDKKPEKKGDKTGKQESKDKLVPVGSIVCKIARVEGAQKYITIQIEEPVLQPSGRGFRIAQVPRDIELQPSDDLKVRILQPPQDFDEKGRPKRYTAKELKEMKGPDSKLPGYSADFDSLKPDQIVKVFLSRRKEAAKPAPKPRVKSKDRDADDAGATENKPEITMVVILAEPKK